MADDDDNGEAPSGSNITSWNVSSECIASLAYDKSKGVAIFTFVRGPNKQYTAPISIQQATAWAFSESPGDYFNEKIKDKFGA